MALLESYQEAIALAKAESIRTGQVVRVRPVGAAFWELTSDALRASERAEQEHVDEKLQRESDEWFAQEGGRQDEHQHEHRQHLEQEGGPVDSDVL